MLGTTVPHGHQAVDRATRQRVTAALGLVLGLMADKLSVGTRYQMQVMHTYLLIEALASEAPAEHVAFSKDERDAATLSLVLAAGLSYVPLGELSSQPQQRRREAAAGLHGLLPLGQEDRQRWDLAEEEALLDGLQDLATRDEWASLDNLFGDRQ